MAEALVAEAESADKAVRLLCRSAGAGDLAAAKALIPWLNQALGMPTERIEHRTPVDATEVRNLTDEQLAELARRGREARLKAVPYPG